MAQDPDLTGLFRTCTNDELDPVVQYILKATTNELDINPTYKANKGNHARYVDPIVSEIRTFGGNSLVNLVRGDGVEYVEIVKDVAGKLRVKTVEGSTVADIERSILLKILADSVEKMSPEERAALQEEFEKAGVKGVDLSAGIPAGVLAAQLAVQMSGFLAYRIAVIVANAVAKAVLGRGLSLAANAALTRILGVLAGPIGWAITGLWTLIDVSGPAYRVTIPVVCHVGFLRQKKEFESLGG